MEAGWYSDPNGGSDLRWWDGSAWTEHTSAPTAEATASTTASPDAPATTGPPPHDAPSAGPPTDIPPGPGMPPGAFPPPTAGDSGGFAPPDPASGGFPPPGPSSGGFPPAGSPRQNDSSRYMLIGLVALIAVLLGVGGVVLLSSGGDDDETTTESTTTTEVDESTTTTSEEDETTTTTTAGEPDSEFVSSGGMTFTRLPAPWQDWIANGQGSIPELEGTAGQFVVVQEEAPSGGQWISNLLIGDLTSSIAYSGEADLPTATQALADALIGAYYVEDAQASLVLEQPITVDGHPGYFMHHELTFQQEGLETTQEKVVVVVVDTGRARPGVFWASIPYNSSELNAGMDQVYASLKVND